MAMPANRPCPCSIITQLHHIHHNHHLLQHQMSHHQDSTKKKHESSMGAGGEEVDVNICRHGRQIAGAGRVEQAGTCATNTTNVSDIDTHQGYCGLLLYDICIGCCLEPPCLWFAPQPTLASTCFRPWQTQRKIPLLSIGCPPGSTRHRQCLDCRKFDHYLLQL